MSIPLLMAPAVLLLPETVAMLDLPSNNIDQKFAISALEESFAVTQVLIYLCST